MTIEEPADQFAIYVIMYVGGLALGAVVVAMLASAVGRVRHGISRARGADRPAWDPGIWHCASCLSTNPPSNPTCRACKRPRHDLGGHPPVVATDVIPERIAVPPGAIVTLHHEAHAHTDPGGPHWRVTVGGQTAGSAATRSGVLALLRALDGADVVLLDIRGDGTAPFHLADVVARFQGPRFPLDVPCPEAASGSAAT